MEGNLLKFKDGLIMEIPPQHEDVHPPRNGLKKAQKRSEKSPSKVGVEKNLS